MGRRFAWLAAALVALNVFFWLAASAFGLGAGTGLAQLLFGPRLMRAEVVLDDGSDYLADRGRIVAVATGSLTLREADGRLVTIATSASTEVTIGRVPASVALLRRGMRATVVRLSNGPATIVQAQRR